MSRMSHNLAANRPAMNRMWALMRWLEVVLVEVDQAASHLEVFLQEGLEDSVLEMVVV